MKKCCVYYYMCLFNNILTIRKIKSLLVSILMTNDNTLLLMYKTMNKLV